MSTPSVRHIASYPPLPSPDAAGRLASIARSLVVTIADDEARARLGHPPLMTLDDLEAFAREVGHYGRVLLSQAVRYCACGERLLSLRDLQAGACQFCRVDQAGRAHILATDPAFLDEVCS